MNTSGGGGLLINGVEVRYMAPSDLLIKEELKYVDIFGMLPLISKLSFDGKSWDPPNLLLSGPTGNGKSLLFAYFAKMNDIPYLSVDCSEGTREGHLRGSYVVHSSGSTPFILGTVSNAIQVANEVGMAMIVFEELNALSPQLQKCVNALTDFKKKIEVPELSFRFSLNPGARLFVGATKNPTDHGGTYELNRDLENRFLMVEVPYPPEELEISLLMDMTQNRFGPDIVKSLVKIAQHTRQDATQTALSPRDLVQILNIIPRVGWNDALFLAAQKFNEADRAVVLSSIKDITRTVIYPNLSERLKVANLGRS